jgi:hypothetical protein
MPEQGGDREPVREATDHRGLGAGPEIADPRKVNGQAHQVTRAASTSRALADCFTLRRRAAAAESGRRGDFTCLVRLPGLD